MDFFDGRRYMIEILLIRNNTNQSINQSSKQASKQFLMLISKQMRLSLSQHIVSFKLLLAVTVVDWAWRAAFLRCSEPVLFWIPQYTYKQTCEAFDHSQVFHRHRRPHDGYLLVEWQWINQLYNSMMYLWFCIHSETKKMIHLLQFAWIFKC